MRCRSELRFGVSRIYHAGHVLREDEEGKQSLKKWLRLRICQDSEQSGRATRWKTKPQPCHLLRTCTNTPTSRRPRRTWTGLIVSDT